MLALSWEVELKHQSNLFVNLCGYVKMKTLLRNISKRLPTTFLDHKKSETKKLPAGEGG